MTTVVVVCAVLLLGALGFALYVRGVRSKYIARILVLRRERMQLEAEVEGLTRDTVLRQARVDTLAKELEELEEVRRREREAALLADAPKRTVIGVLQANGRITAEDVLRAKTYIESTKAGCTEEEALIILGILTDVDVREAAGELE